jgi:hypothetical protein
MSEPEIFFDYHGPLDYSVIDSLLIKLKATREYSVLNKTTGKRLYSMVVECLENIIKHSELSILKNPAMYSKISVGDQDGKITIKAGNPVTADSKVNIAGRLDHLNNSDVPTLKALYEDKIRSDLNHDDICAGLGFIYIALKSGNKITYSFRPLTNGYLYFEIKITLNKFIMRKLIIDQKSSSPKVILDPENKIYLISGESRPPDVREFYGQVLEWLDEYSSHLIKPDNKKEPVIFNFDFEYFNSSSGKLILDICKILAGLQQKGVNVKINWHFEKDDNDMLEAGKEMSRIVRFPFEYVESGIN